MVLLRRVKDMLDQHCMQIVNVDGTVIAQRPKLSPLYSPDERQHCLCAGAFRLSDQSESDHRGGGWVSPDQVEGIAAQAVALLEKSRLK